MDNKFLKLSLMVNNLGFIDKRNIKWNLYNFVYSYFVCFFILFYIISINTPQT